MGSVRHLALFASLCATGAVAAADTLADLRWHYRVIAVFTPNHSAQANARDVLERPTGIVARDIAWFVFGPNDMTSNIDTGINRASLVELHDRAGFEAALIGKDGGVKSRQTETLDLPSFFDDIDAMPMRRREMQSSP